MTQKQVTKPRARDSKGRYTTEQTATATTTEPQRAEIAEKLKAELDDLLDEIDAVLEENAEEFVSQYIQKGGE